MVYKRSHDSKRALRFNLLVSGCQGTGKTTFINSLLDQNLIPHRYHQATASQTIPKTITFTNLSSVSATEMHMHFEPSLADKEPGMAISETSVEIIDEDDSKILLTIIDTPGFGDNIDNEICVSELCSFLEQQFDLVLAEETKVRRNPRFEDTRVHVCLYFIEPTGHGLRELDVVSMSKMSKFVNVIPVIGRSDSFTKLELTNFKRNIMQDIERFKIPIFQFIVDEEEEDDEVIEESQYLTNLQPFAIITSDTEAEVDGKKTRVRKYPWGQIDINDTSVSDFAVLKSVVLGSHLQELKDITHDYLYEAYRTEKLEQVAEITDIKFGNSTTNLVSSSAYATKSLSSEVPSMSNLAEIANSQSMKKFDIPKTRNENNKIDNNTNVTAVAASLADITIEEEGEDSHNGDSIIHSAASEVSSKLSASTETFQAPSTHIVASSRSNSQSSTPIERQSPSFQYSETHIQHAPLNPSRLRKISETVPYMLRQESIRTKQAKLEELERQSALEMARRAAELERKARELKRKEGWLKERMASMDVQSVRSQATTQSNTTHDSNATTDTVQIGVADE
ncbi:septin [Martiniozyma asiatica (nom. inval.)]|nr:septin [Martiniozyma asiatica]